MKIDGKPEFRPRKIDGNDLSKLGDLLMARSGKISNPDASIKKELTPDEESNKIYSEYLKVAKKELTSIKQEFKKDKQTTLSARVSARRAMKLINEIKKATDVQKTYFTLLSNKLDLEIKDLDENKQEDKVKIEKINKSKIEYQNKINNLDIEVNKLNTEYNFFMSYDDRTGDIHYEINKKEIIDEYFFNKGISQVIIHGAESSVINKETGEEEGYLKSKIDFDVWSAMKLMELGGVKFQDGAKTSWVNPKEELNYDEEGKPYYNNIDGKLYLDPGAVILDMSNTFGVSITAGDVIKIDHHGEKNLKKTSTTKELFDVLNGNIEFSKNIMKNTKTKDLVWLENYIEFVTKVDNLDYIVNPENWEKYNETMFALQKYFNGGKHEIVLDIFKNHPKINLNGFNKEELDYVIAIGDKFFNNNDIKKQRPVYKNITSLKHKGESKDPEFFKKDYFQKDRLIHISDIVQIQKNGLHYSNKSIEENELDMYMKNLNTNSPFLGKVIIDEIDSNKNLRNLFGAVSAYGHGYDSYLILNLNGKQKNDIFVSTKKDPNKFVNRLREEFKKVLVDKYQDKTVLIVRDTMVIVRDEAVKELDIDKLREIIIKALDIGGYTPEKRMEELLKEAEESSKSTRQFLESIS